MKALIFKVGLLLVLFAVCSCDSSSRLVCCHKFFENRIPKTHILSISKTYIRCSTPAFVIETPRGEYCVRQTVKWAMTQFIEQELKKQASAAASMKASSRSTRATP